MTSLRYGAARRFSFRNVALSSAHALMAMMLLVTGQHTEKRCIRTTNQLQLYESYVEDTSTKRTYVLCPNTDFRIGVYDDFLHELKRGQQMIHLRPNMHIKCGDSGSLDNACRLTGGTIQVDGTTHFGYDEPNEVLENVVLEGITFVNATKYMVWLNKPGDVEFRECEFKDSTLAITPILAEYHYRNTPDTVNSELAVSFFWSRFSDNTYYMAPDSEPYPYFAQPAIVVGNSVQNRLVFEECSFVNNNMVQGMRVTDARRNSFLVESYGPVTMVRNCFELNSVGHAPVVVFGGGLQASSAAFFADNYRDDVSAGTKCQLAAHYTTGDDYADRNPTCYNFDTDVCLITGTRHPTASPTTSQPSALPSQSPSASPSNAPSRSVAPSLAPSASPSWSPSASPSSYPTGIPSSVPSFRPSRIPSDAPTLVPSVSPSLGPTTAPSLGPTIVPSATPSVEPSSFPSLSPTDPPSLFIESASGDGGEGGDNSDDTRSVSGASALLTSSPGMRYALYASSVIASTLIFLPDLLC